MLTHILGLEYNVLLRFLSFQLADFTLNCNTVKLMTIYKLLTIANK